MKFSYLFALLFIPVLFYSCNRDLNGVGPGVNGANGNVIVANINGVAWGATDGYVQTIPPGGIAMTGVRSGNNSNSIEIVISPYTGLGTYQVNGLTKISYSEGGVNYSSTTGQITVNADNDQVIEGFFNCEMISNTGSQSLSFTNGQFQVPKQ